MTVRSVSAYKKHKLSAILVKDINNMLNSVNYSIKLFQGWAHYKPAKAVLTALLLSKGELESHKAKYEKLEADTAPEKK